MTNDIKYRQARENDISEICSIIKDAIKEMESNNIEILEYDQASSNKCFYMIVGLMLFSMYFPYNHSIAIVYQIVALIVGVWACKDNSCGIGFILILNVARELGGNSSDITVNNSGWVQLGQTGLSGTTDFRGAVFYKIATAFEPGSYVVVPAAWASVSRAGGAIVAFRGVDSENPIDIQGLITSVPNTTNTIALSPISTTVANTLVVQVGMNIRTENGTRSFTGWNTVNPGALTAVYNLASTNPIRTRLGLATRLKPNIGTTGNSSIVVNGNSNKAGIMFALRPEQPRHFRTRVNWGDFNAASTWD